MEKKVVRVCRVVGLLGVLSAVFGFVAEAIRISESWFLVTASNHCAYSSTFVTFFLGITAILALLISQIVLNVAAGCICCIKGGPRFPDSYWGVALISFILSWFTFVIAVLKFLNGALFGNYRCHFGSVGAFSGGAIMGLANSAFGIAYYLTLTASGQNKNGGANPNQEGIAMGQAQIPEINQDPVFVQEDTYNRRQFP